MFSPSSVASLPDVPHKSLINTHLLGHLLGALGHDAQHVDDEDDDAGDQEVIRRPV